MCHRRNALKNRSKTTQLFAKPSDNVYGEEKGEKSFEDFAAHGKEEHMIAAGLYTIDQLAAQCTNRSNATQCQSDIAAYSTAVEETGVCGGKTSLACNRYRERAGNVQPGTKLKRKLGSTGMEAFKRLEKLANGQGDATYGPVAPPANPPTPPTSSDVTHEISIAVGGASGGTQFGLDGDLVNATQYSGPAAGFVRYTPQFHLTPWLSVGPSIFLGGRMTQPIIDPETKKEEGRSTGFLGGVGGRAKLHYRNIVYVAAELHVTLATITETINRLAATDCFYAGGVMGGGSIGTDVIPHVGLGFGVYGVGAWNIPAHEATVLYLGEITLRLP